MSDQDKSAKDLDSQQPDDEAGLYVISVAAELSVYIPKHFVNTIA